MALCQVFSLEGGGIALCSGLSPSLLSPTGNPVGSAFQHSPVLTASHHPTFSPSCSLLVGCHESLYTVLLLLSPPLCPVCSPWILGDRFTGKLSRGQMVPRSAHRCLTTSHRSQSNSKSPSALPDRRPLHVPPPPPRGLAPRPAAPLLVSLLRQPWSSFPPSTQQAHSCPGIIVCPSFFQECFSSGINTACTFSHFLQVSLRISPHRRGLL